MNFERLPTNASKNENSASPEKNDVITLKDGTKVRVNEINNDMAMVEGLDAKGQLLKGRMTMATLENAKRARYLGINDEITTEDGSQITIKKIDRETGFASVEGTDANGKPIAGQMSLNKLEKIDRV